MLLGGLWHGASLRFVVWGALHGLYLAIHKGIMTIFPNKTSPRYRVLSVFITFHIVAFTWMAFRAANMQVVIDMCGQIFNHFEGRHFIDMVIAYKAVWSLIALAFIIHWLPVKAKNWYRGYFVLLPTWVKVLVTIIVIIVLAQFTSAELQPFIYFQF
jgi:D-alanyl-lipoteichoic acid acyltransferase DltB (MBOAT superfamily)